MEPAEESITQYRIPMTVSSVRSETAVVSGHKDRDGRPVLVYGPKLWYVHFAGSTESLCFGEERPNFTVGEVVDIIIRKRNA